MFIDYFWLLVIATGLLLYNMAYKWPARNIYGYLNSYKPSNIQPNVPTDI